MQSAGIATDPLAYTLLLAAAIHGALILGLGFVPEPHEPAARHRQSLRVVLVRPDPEPPAEVKRPEFLAQSSKAGSGNAGITVPSGMPPPVPTPQAPAAPPPPPPTAKPPDKPRLSASPTPDGTAGAQPAPDARPKPASRPKPKRRVSAARLLASRSEEISRLTAELERKSREYAKRPRRKAISASTTEYKYASYLEAWRRKVENIGNLNYPDEAKRKKLYGNLVLHVSVHADGSVAQVRVLHSSGHKILDDAAVRIVKLAAPFAPFPPDIRAETDILDITRTWQFLSSNRLGWD